MGDAGRPEPTYRRDYRKIGQGRLAVDAFVWDKGAYDSNVNDRTAADTALLATMDLRCQPWPLPLDKYEI